MMCVLWGPHGNSHTCMLDIQLWGPHASMHACSLIALAYSLESGPMKPAHTFAGLHAHLPLFSSNSSE